MRQLGRVEGPSTVPEFQSGWKTRWKPAASPALFGTRRTAQDVRGEGELGRGARHHGAGACSLKASPWVSRTLPASPGTVPVPWESGFVHGHPFQIRNCLEGEMSCRAISTKRGRCVPKSRATRAPSDEHRHLVLGSQRSCSLRPAGQFHKRLFRNL